MQTINPVIDTVLEDDRVRATTRSPLLQRTGAVLGFIVGAELAQRQPTHNMNEMMSLQFKQRYSADYLATGRQSVSSGPLLEGLLDELRVLGTNHSGPATVEVHCLRAILPTVFQVVTDLPSISNPWLRACLASIRAITSICQEDYRQLEKPRYWNSVMQAGGDTFTDDAQRLFWRQLGDLLLKLRKKPSSTWVNQLGMPLSALEMTPALGASVHAILLAMALVCQQGYWVRPVMIEASQLLPGNRLVPALVGSLLGLAHGQGSLPDEWLTDLSAMDAIVDAVMSI